MSKQHGDGTRILGIPCVGDRVTQTVVARHLVARVEPVFHEDSYGYRPNRSALDAVERCRQRCWKRDWVIDLDVAKFFDPVPWHLVVKAVRAHTDARWVVLYVTRWLQAPLRQPDGTLAACCSVTWSGPLQADGGRLPKAERLLPEGVFRHPRANSSAGRAIPTASS
jgi:hypothetical protein